MKGLLKFGAPLLRAFALAVGLCIFAVLVIVYAGSPGNGGALPVVRDAFAAGGGPVAATAPESAQQDTLAHQEQAAQAQAQGQAPYVHRGEPGYTLPGEAVPLASIPEDGVALVSRQGEPSWSLGNSALSFIGLTEGLLAVVCFFTRSTHIRPNLLTWDFTQRLLALLMAFVLLIFTSIASDFTGSVTVFDRMSPSVIILFALQQALLLALLSKRAPAPPGKGMRSRFRAQRRYED
jgi:hypothetical protein